MNTSSANFESNFTVDFMNYSNTTTFKTKLSKVTIPASSIVQDVSLWRNTSAITSITVIVPAANNWIAGSTFTLYGIKAA